eukprot:481748_1
MACSPQPEEMLHILSNAIIHINQDVSFSNSFNVHETVHALLNEHEIVQYWKEQRYDAHWLICTQKEVFVAEFINQWQDISLLTAIKLYDELRRRFIRVNEKRYNNHTMPSDPDRPTAKQKFIFIWDDAIQQLRQCDHTHFLFICSRIIDQINAHRIENYDYPLFDRKQILFSLQRIHINGVLFVSIPKITFVQSLQYSMVQLSSKEKDINMAILNHLTDDTPKQYAQILYDKLKAFDIENSIKKDQICALNLNDEDTKWSKITKTIHAISTNKHGSIPSSDVLNRINLKNEIDQKMHNMDKSLPHHAPTCADTIDDKEWTKMTRFDAIESIGYVCDDGIVVIGHIIDHEVGSKVKLKFKTDYLSDPFLLDGLWIDIPNEKICNPLNTTESHRHIFNKWIVILAHKLQYNMPFDRDLFETISKICDNHPMLLFTLKYDNYQCALSNKDYPEILKSFFSWFMTLKCERTNCDKKLKMLCRCDCNTFPLFTFHLLLALIEAKNVTNTSIVTTIINEDHTRNIKGIVKEISALLPEYLKKNYMKRYKDYIGYWLRFDFYNFVCSYCSAINCTIMVNRIFSYNSSLRHCRVCGTKKFAVHMQEQDKVSASIHWICERLKDPDIREFEPERAKIRYINLRKALSKCRYDGNIFYDYVCDEATLFQILNTVATQLDPTPHFKSFFDAFYYYIRHFCGYDKWAELRLNISLNYHLFQLDASYVTTKVLMQDAGFIGLFDENIFRDCYERAFCSNANYDEDMIRMLFYDKHKLCIDDASLRGMKHNSPSVKKFAQDVVQSVAVSSSYLFENGECTIDHGWVYGKEETLNAIRVWSADGQNGVVNGIQLQINGEWDINKIYGNTQGTDHQMILDVSSPYGEEMVTGIWITFTDTLRYIEFETNLNLRLGCGDYRANGQKKLIGEKLIGLRISTNKDVITGIQFKWRHSNAFDDVHKKLMKVVKNLEKFKINCDVFPILTLSDFKRIVSTRYHGKDALHSITADTIWWKLNAKYPRESSYRHELTYALIGDLMHGSSGNVGLLGDVMDGSKRKHAALRIKTMMAFYDRTHHKVPTFDEFVSETKLQIVDELQEDIRLKYDALYDKYGVKEEDVAAAAAEEEEEDDDNAQYNFLTGIFMRYTVLKPRFTCLAEECMLNEVVRMNMTRWNALLCKAKEIYRRINMFSRSESNKNYGIERYMPIGIQHIIGIQIYTESTDYAHQLSRSYWRMRLDKSNEAMIAHQHCNNFYWIGRFLFEAVEFYGERFDENNKEYQLYQGMRHIYKFDNFSCCLNYPSSTSNNKNVAKKFAGEKGCVIKFRPKYIGKANNTKFMNISELSGFDDEGERLFFGNTCELQIERITLHPNGANMLNLREYLPALIYLEKILQQTMFNVQFYNSADLYTNSKKTQKLLLKLIDIYLDDSCDLFKHFTAKLKPKQQRAIRYIVSLLSNWCKEREYVSFETLHLEYEYMIDKLRQFFTEKLNQRFYIKRKNIMNLLPNLKYYRNYDKQLIYVVNPNKTEELEEDSISSEEAWYKPLTPRNKSVRFSAKVMQISFGKPQSVDSFAFGNDGMTRNTTQDSEWETYTECDYEEDVKYNANHQQKATQWITYAQPHAIPLIMLELLDEIGFDFEASLSVRKRAIRAEILKWNITRHDIFDAESDVLVHILSAFNVTRSMAEKVRLHLCKKKTTKKGKIASLLVDELEMCGFKFNLMECSAIEMDAYRAKRLFLDLYKKPLSRFHALIQNWDKTAPKHFVDLVLQMKDLSVQIADKLYEHLFRKILEEKSRIKPWKCSHCWFRNRQLLIGKQWRFYNLEFECGLCGESRIDCETKPDLYRDRTFGYCLDGIKEDAIDSFQLPSSLKRDWRNIPKQKCMVNKVSLANLSMVLSAEEDDGSTDEDDEDDEDSQNEDHHFGFMMTALDKTLSTGGNDSPLPLSRSPFDVVNCSTIHRLCVILKHFHFLTREISETRPFYRYGIKAFLSKLPGYSAIKLIDDVDHLLRCHDDVADTINYEDIQQRYGILCESYEECVFSRRSQRETQQKVLDIGEKKALFHSHNMTDFVYISVLDRAHVVLLHCDDDIDISKKLLHKDSRMIAKYSTYPVYSTGVYMQYDALNPLHLHLREEMTCNKLCHIGRDDWTLCLEKAKLFIQSSNAKGIWRSNESNPEHGIEKNDPLQIEHILSIIFYCDFSDLCEAFRGTYRRRTQHTTDEEVQQLHSTHFYWFGRFVYGAIQFCGQKPLKPSRSKKNRAFYHGLKEKFLFNYFSASYETPTSTTYDLSVAQSFAGRGGIILELGPKYKTEVNYSRCLDVSTISDYTAEKERLFAGMTELAIINIIDLGASGDEERYEMAKYMKVILYFERLCEQTVYNKDYYNYGQCTLPYQSLYLAPLIRKQMQRNSTHIAAAAAPHQNIPTYIAALFEHFCDSKDDYINLTCIHLQKMHHHIKQILFRNDDQINNKNLKLIFPKLRKYKNPLDHWITLRD